ncbi:MULTISPECIES: helix-turn-helix domain-containing protein [Calditerrivibrio]|uniref:helix-turn-helix domain-containing protein n=1 Tax=Calditerrivibrio TaxID=545865 RepID=UPI003C758E89
MNKSYISKKIRNLRKSQGITLEQLAKAIGKTKSYVSMLENEKAIPSLSTLKEIVSFFNMTIADFFEESDQKSDFNKEVFNFSSDAELIYSKKNEFNLYLLHKNKSFKMKTYIVELFPEGGYSQSLKHEGEEQGYILQGRVELIIDEKSYELSSGQYFYFDSSKSHRVRNLDNEISRIFWIYLPK